MNPTVCRDLWLPVALFPYEVVRTTKRRCCQANLRRSEATACFARNSIIWIYKTETDRARSEDSPTRGHLAWSRLPEPVACLPPSNFFPLSSSSRCAFPASYRFAEMAGQNSLIVKLSYSSSAASAINKACQFSASKARRASASASSPSSKQAARTKITSHFTQSQLALALAIQKAKPEALSTHSKQVISLPLLLPTWLQNIASNCATVSRLANLFRLMDCATSIPVSSGRINTPRFIERTRHCETRFTGSNKEEWSILRDPLVKRIIVGYKHPMSIYLQSLETSAVGAMKLPESGQHHLERIEQDIKIKVTWVSRLWTTFVSR